MRSSYLYTFVPVSILNIFLMSIVDFWKNTGSLTRSETWQPKKETRTSPVPRKKLSSVDPTNSLGILASASCYAKCFADGCDVHRNLVYISLLKVAQGSVLEYIMYNV